MIDEGAYLTSTLVLIHVVYFVMVCFTLKLLFLFEKYLLIVKRLSILVTQKNKSWKDDRIQS